MPLIASLIATNEVVDKPGFVREKSKNGGGKIPSRINIYLVFREKRLPK